MKAINPASGDVIKDYHPHISAEVEEILQGSQTASGVWARTPLEERCRLMKKAGEVLLKRKQELAQIITLELGKPIKESIAEIEKCASNCEYYSQNAATFLKSESIKTEAVESYVSYLPLGTVLAIMPWNFPFWQAIRFAAPGMCAGNTVILKHASNVPGCALALEQVFTEAGFPENSFRTLLISSQEVEKVIQHPTIKAVTLTGSTAAGKSVARAAGEVLKKCVLELGGSDAYLILDDADLDHAAKTLVQGRMMNAGQSCISAKRLIVDQQIYPEFQQKVLSHLKDIQPADPALPETKLGPMARDDLRQELHKQVEASLEKGARCLLGGKVPTGKGAFYPATLLVDVKPGMPAFDEELFGPVVVLIPAKDEAEAIKLANQSPYGLGGGVFSQDLDRAKRIAEHELQSGGAFVNDFLKSDPRLPFGGIKESGYGRELSMLGIREFVNAKTIVIKRSKQATASGAE